VSDDCCSGKGDTIAGLDRKADQRRVLIIVMVINFAMFLAEFGAGIVARSSALVADWVDMFGDARVYALSPMRAPDAARSAERAAYTSAGSPSRCFSSVIG